MARFSFRMNEQVQLEARVHAQDFDAAVDYLRRFVDGEPIDTDYVLRALALIAVDPFRPSDAA
jgi:hypothetical protein